MPSRTLSWSNHPCVTLARCALLLMAACSAAACGGDDNGDELSCVGSLPATCTPDVDPTFESIYTSVFSQHCGSSGSGNTCHAKGGNPKSDLKLSDPTTAYQALLGQNGNKVRVIPGDPHCSPLMERLESDDPSKRMPYMEDKLPPGLRCAIQQWIEKGAPR